MDWNRIFLAGLMLALFWVPVAPFAADVPSSWRYEWPNTDFSKHSIGFKEIQSGGPPKDGIPSIDEPVFQSAQEVSDLPGSEPVISLILNGVGKAYPLRILTWHEIVNDEVGGVPVAVTYCPLCNAAIVFDRRVNGRLLTFGTTGKLRHSDLIMYDRQTESWWQQFLGVAIVGEMTSARLAILPARVEAFDSFRRRFPEGFVLIPNDPSMRPYGANPYTGYDSSSAPFLYRGDLPEDIPSMTYLVVVGSEAWTLESLREAGTLESGEFTLQWRPGMNSALDHRAISEGRDIGQVEVTKNGQLVPYHVTFAFVFHAFEPNGKLHR